MTTLTLKRHLLGPVWKEKGDRVLAAGIADIDLKEMTAGNMMTETYEGLGIVDFVKAIEIIHGHGRFRAPGQLYGFYMLFNPD